MLNVGHHFPLSEMVQWPLSQDSIQIAYIGLSPRSHDQYLASSASPILLMSPLLSPSISILHKFIMLCFAPILRASHVMTSKHIVCAMVQLRPTPHQYLLIQTPSFPNLSVQPSKPYTTGTIGFLTARSDYTMMPLDLFVPSSIWAQQILQLRRHGSRPTAPIK